MKTIIGFIIFFLLSCNSQPKDKTIGKNDGEIKQVSINLDIACAYSNEISSESIYTFSAGNDAELAIKKIIAQTGLPQNFKIAAADVDNAIAVIQTENDQQVRYILYNQEFFKIVEEKTQSKFAALSILAHEIGHHLSGHTLNKGGSRPLLELESDRFSGFILKKMGASLSESQIAVRTFCSKDGSSTHPPQKARLASITNGWMDADQSIKLPVTASENIGSPVKYTHQISVAPKWSLAFRSRVLTAVELQIINTPNNPEKINIDANTLIAALQPNSKLILINEAGPSFFKISAMINGVMKTGFIAKKVYQQSTIVPL